MHDTHAQRELSLTIDNTKRWYDWKILCFTNLAKKRDKEIYDHTKGPKIFKSLIDTAAKTYVREHGSMGDKWQTTFSVITRKKLADELAEEFLAWYREDWPSLRPVKKTRAKKA